ncbi:hypothetical protein L596_009677 [Steinernema carpocapsae]|uniref:Lipocalin/cytosolic fatty-acid binding domain-containing protein n=1 Tax=Steinernema carpocapsae TaxID=34508 RepID=A0A4U5PG14_STECR|nr:hypothetical protein L596_009677 [Steinernema carpocapsae]
MCDNFVGFWKLVDSENFDDYMKAVGAESATRRMVVAGHPMLEISLDGDKIRMKTHSTFQNRMMEFRLNEEIEHDTVEDRRVKSTFEVADGKLLQHEKPTSANGTASKIVRWIEGDTLIETLEAGSVQCKRVYKKQ